jgi:membrane-associated phospholipid phosphatase
MSGQAYSAERLAPEVVLGEPGVPPSGVRAPLLAAAACAAGMALVWGLAEHVAAIRAHDASALYHLTLLDRPSIEAVGNTVLRLLEPLPFALWSFLLVGFALLARRVREAIAAAVVLVFAPLTAEVLKPLLAHPHDAVGRVQIGPSSWPSGHATAALAFVGAAYLIASVRVKPLVAGLGAAFAAAVGLLLLILAWHLPSDVIGGYLLAGLWTALAASALRASRVRTRREPRRTSPSPRGALPQPR